MLSSGAVGPDAGELHWLGGISARTLISGSSTDGRFSVVEHLLQPRELAAPLHLHTQEDEVSVVTHGSVGFVLGGRLVTAGPGEVVTKPREEWHTFFNAGDEQARLLEWISPAGFEDYFVELAALFPADAPPDLDGLAEATERYGLQMDMASLPDLVERYDLARPPEMDGQGP